MKKFNPDTKKEVKQFKKRQKKVNKIFKEMLKEGYDPYFVVCDAIPGDDEHFTQQLMHYIPN